MIDVLNEINVLKLTTLHDVVDNIHFNKWFLFPSRLRGRVIRCFPFEFNLISELFLRVDSP